MSHTRANLRIWGPCGWQLRAGVLVHTEPDLCPHSPGLLGDGGHFSWICFLATPALTIQE